MTLPKNLAERAPVSRAFCNARILLEGRSHKGCFWESNSLQSSVSFTDYPAQMRRRMGLQFWLPRYTLWSPTGVPLLFVERA